MSQGDRSVRKPTWLTRCMAGCLDSHKRHPRAIYWASAHPFPVRALEHGVETGHALATVPIQHERDEDGPNTMEQELVLLTLDPQQLPDVPDSALLIFDELNGSAILDGAIPRKEIARKPSPRPR